MLKVAHHGHVIRLITPYANTRFGKRSLSFDATRIYKKLPTNITEQENLEGFKIKAKTYLFKLLSVELEYL